MPERRNSIHDIVQVKNHTYYATQFPPKGRQRKGIIIMWTRKELKEQSKKALMNNYVSSILVGIVVAFCCGTLIYRPYQVNYNITPEVSNEMYQMPEAGEANIGVFIFLAIILLFIIAASVAINVFFFAPLKVSGYRFFIKNLDEPANASEVIWAFSYGYVKDIAATTFTTGLITFLYTLLLVIPGIIKGYEYMMVPFILAEDPEIPPSEARRKSSVMMNGNKMNAFILHLSFIGWYILSVLTFGFAGIFFVNPYYYGTDAALYKRLKETGAIDKEDVPPEAGIL